MIHSLGTFVEEYAMRGSGELLSYVDVEARVRRDHPLRAIGVLANGALDALSGAFSCFTDQRAVPQSLQRCFCAMLVQAFYSIGSGRQMMEHLQFDFLFRKLNELPKIRLFRQAPATSWSIFSSTMAMIQASSASIGELFNDH